MPTAHDIGHDHDHDHGPNGHGDRDSEHGDSEHGDSGHGDSGHGDSGYGDRGHGDVEQGAGGHAGHDHGVSADADRRWLSLALALISLFMLGEVVVGLIAHSLALLSDAGHMLTDAGAIVLALIAMRLAARPPRGGYTYGLKRAEILSAQANGLTMLILAVWLGVEAIRRLIDPPAVVGPLVLITALSGIVINLIAAWAMSKANRSSLNIEGAFRHIVNDLYAFIATAVAGAVILATGFTRADPIATLVVVVLMTKAGLGLVRESGKVFLEAAPTGLEPPEIGARVAAVDDVVEVHDLHVWQITSGQPALSAHVLVVAGGDCHAVRRQIEALLRSTYRISHSTLQVDHFGQVPADLDDHCAEPHGVSYRSGP
ncbi:cation diffusion facilitator family transporter [Actinoplanes sp. NPDC051343]|uniref:cation diffusion facilitator family transporter n=1 Tax=Actinoplanes sp. NPDC051343 TaxID=3363906 RepID=UPI0037A3ED5C